MRPGYPEIKRAAPYPGAAPWESRQVYCLAAKSGYSAKFFFASYTTRIECEVVSNVELACKSHAKGDLSGLSTPHFFVGSERPLGPVGFVSNLQKIGDSSCGVPSVGHKLSLLGGDFEALLRCFAS